jgi:hypothetical protein
VVIPARAEREPEIAMRQANVAIPGSWLRPAPEWRPVVSSTSIAT